MHYTISGKKKVLDVIKKYKEHPCLWQAAHHDYHNKSKRNAALEDLLTLFRTQDPAANKDTVLKKINSLRGCFRKEFNKIKVSMLSAAGADGVHVPKLWYYDHMLFLEDQEAPGELRPAQCAPNDAPLGEEDESMDDLQSMDPLQLPQSELSSTSKHSPSSSSLSFKKIKADADAVLPRIAKRLERMRGAKKRQKRSHDTFGEYVAEQLREMPSKMQKICKKIINDAIFYAEIETLNYTSRIVTDLAVESNPTRDVKH